MCPRDLEHIWGPLLYTTGTVVIDIDIHTDIDIDIDIGGGRPKGGASLRLICQTGKTHVALILSNCMFLGNTCCSAPEERHAVVVF